MQLCVGTCTYEKSVGGVGDAKTFLSPTMFSFSSLLVQSLPATSPGRQPPPTADMYYSLATSSSRMSTIIYSTFQRLYGRYEFGRIQAPLC